MQIALVNGERRYAEKGLRGACPACRAELRPHCGEIVPPYWSHKAAEDCDHWSEPETQWHAEWKTAAPFERREVVKGPHIADVIAGDGAVCEIQHSAISAEQIREREAFYGREMRWIFDARDKEFELEPRDDDERYPHGFWFHRSVRWPTIKLCQRRVMLDLGSDGVLSCEWINKNGSAGWGCLYPHQTVRMWLAGREYWEQAGRAYWEARDAV